MPKVPKTKTSKCNDAKPKRARVPTKPPVVVSGMPPAEAVTAVAIALKLMKDGVVVFPMLTPVQVAEFRTMLNDATKVFPEYNREFTTAGALVSTSGKYVGGSFGALGNSSVTHCVVIRLLRRHIYDAVLPILMAILGTPDFQAQFPTLRVQEAVDTIVDTVVHSVYTEFLIDRLGIRAVGTGGGSESWHRDWSPKALHDDFICGGWLNLGPKHQYFVCQLGSHVAASWITADPTARSDVGFEPIKDPAKRAALDATGVHVDIPEGCAVMFLQCIAHAVCATSASALAAATGATPKSLRASKMETKLPSVRLYFGTRITRDHEPLGGIKALHDALTDMGPVKVKSDEDCRLHPKLYGVNHIDLLERWSKEAFNAALPGLFESVEVKSTGRKYDRVVSVCPSLKALGIQDRPDVLALCPPYTDAERAMYLPKLVTRGTV